MDIYQRHVICSIVSSHGHLPETYILAPGGAIVPVADCACEEFSAHPKSEMSFKEYIRYWRSKVTGTDDVSTQLLYLKDWHFIK